MAQQTKRKLDYEALAYASKLLGFDAKTWPSFAVTLLCRRQMMDLGVEDPNSHEVRLFRRAVYRIRSAP